jgi:hypothetical protein
VALRLQPLVDERPRQQQESLWHVAGRKVQAEELVHWIDSGLAQLSGEFFTVDTTPGAGDPTAWILTPRLRHAYASHLAATKSAQIVIEFELRSPLNGTTCRLVRGRRTNMNWASTESEIANAMRAALQDCLRKISTELDKLCHPSNFAPPAFPTSLPTAAGA